MYKLSKYKAYKINLSSRLGVIYAVIAYSKNEDNNRFYVEWYYFVKNVNSKIKSSFYTISCSVKPNNIWLDLQENLKQGIYYNEIVPLLEKIGYDFDFNKKYNLEKLDLNFFDNNNPFNKYVRKHTKCNELREYLNNISKNNY
jgi:hypothetical protein